MDKEASEPLGHNGPHSTLLGSELPGILWTTDRHLRVTHLEMGKCDAFPLTSGGCLGRCADEVLAGGVLTERLVEWHRRALGGETVAVLLALDSRRWRGWLGPLRDDAGTVVGCVGRAHPEPVEEADRAMQITVDQFRVAFSESPLGMCIVDLQGRCLQANRVLCAMLGCSEDDVRGESLLELVRADLRRSVRGFARMLHGRTPSCTWQSRYLRADGQAVWMRITAAVVRNSQDRILLGLGMVEDITTQRHTEEALRRAERAHSIGTLAAGIAHEINNPIAAIALSAGAALRALESPEKRQILEDALQNIRQSAQRCGRIVQTILQFSRNPEGELRLADPIPSLRRAMDAVSGLAQRRRVSLETTVSADPPKMVMNATEIEHVLTNLLANAIQASLPGGRVELKMDVASDEVRLIVQDWGHGMTAEQLRHVFDPFFTTRQHEGGTGLGLSLAYSMVKHHGGRIDVRSEVGRGTTMAVVLPRPSASRRPAG